MREFPTGYAVLETPVNRPFPSLEKLAQAATKLGVRPPKLSREVAEGTPAPVVVRPLSRGNRFVEPFEAAPRRGALVFQDPPDAPRLKRLRLLLEDLHAEVFLAAVMIVEVAAADPAGLKDVVEGGRVVAALVEQLSRGIEDLLPASLIPPHYHFGRS